MTGAQGGWPKKSKPQEPYIHTLDGKRGVHVVVVYLVLGSCRVPWSLRLWQGAGTASPVQLALGQLQQVPCCLRQGYRLMVLGDGGFGTVDFLQGLKALEMPAVLTMRADRQLEDGRQLREIRGCEEVRPTKLGFSLWATRLRLKGADGQPGQWRHVVSTKALCGKMIKRWGKRRFAIEISQPQCPHKSFCYPRGSSLTPFRIGYTP